VVKAQAAAVVLGLFGLPAGAGSNDEYFPYLDCAALITARSEYNRVLGRSPEGHLSYLKQQADHFLRVANWLAPLRDVACEDNPGPVIGLKYCLGTRFLLTEMEDLTLDKLTRLVEENGGIYPLPTCMEDEKCAACMRLPYPEIQPKAP
jgi:hypothetical protein